MTKKLSCLLVEDEPLAAGILEEYIAQVPWLCFVGRCPDALSAAEALREQSVDAMFLDIHLPGLKGLDFLRTLLKPPQVILTTAYHSYAIESYDYGVVDYLLKPIDFERFLKAIQKFKTPPELPATGLSMTVNQNVAIRPFRFFNVNKKMVRVWLDEILYAESLKEYLRIWLSDGKSILTKMQLGDLEESLNGKGFIRAHRSYLIAFRHLEAYSATTLHIAGQELTIGRQYREIVLAALNGL